MKDELEYIDAALGLLGALRATVAAELQAWKPAAVPHLIICIRANSAPPCGT